MDLRLDVSEQDGWSVLQVGGEIDVATAPRQVWAWDMTFLPTKVAGRWFYLDLILDVYSR